MSEEYHPEVVVTVTPSKISKGQMISIQAYIQDRYTKVPMKFDHIYMDIIDESGVPSWPLSTVELESSSISKLISTSELDEGKTYTVRVSPSRKLSPYGSAQFHIDRDLIPLALLVPGEMLIPHLLLSTPSSTVPEKDESHVVQPEQPFKIAWLIYRTQLDSKVCPICTPLEGLRFRPDDPDLIKIGDKQHAGDTHYGCRCHYDVLSEAEEQEIYQASLAKWYYMGLQQYNYASTAVAAAYFVAQKG